MSDDELRELRRIFGISENLEGYQITSLILLGFLRGEQRALNDAKKFIEHIQGDEEKWRTQREIDVLECGIRDIKKALMVRFRALVERAKSSS